MKKMLRFGLVLSPAEKQALAKLAEVEGGLSKAALVRRLIRRSARQLGFWPPTNPVHADQPRQDVINHCAAPINTSVR